MWPAVQHHIAVSKKLNLQHCVFKPVNQENGLLQAFIINLDNCIKPSTLKLKLKLIFESPVSQFLSIKYPKFWGVLTLILVFTEC